MATKWLALLACGALLAPAACGGSSTTDNGTPDGSSTDATTGPHDGAAGDTAPGTDAATPADGGVDAPGPFDGGQPFNCGAAPCTGSDVCCVSLTDGGVSQMCAPSCGDGGAAVSCNSPTNCTASDPFCCATIKLTGGTLPNCTVGSVAASCASSCTGQYAGSCVATDTARLCNVAADCASDPNNQSCCDLMGNGQKVTVCISSSFAAFLTCHP
jgi:hypothetical protein